MHLVRALRALVADAEGQDVVEYGILIAGIVLVVLLAVNNFGQIMLHWYDMLAGRITTTGT